MHNETLAETVKSMLTEILSGDPACFLVDFRVKPVNNLKIFLDGDDGITIEKCTRINRALYKRLEESALFPEGDFSLEVSSAGLDEPLKLPRQYKKNLGRTVEILLLDGSQKAGRLKAVLEDGIVLEEASGKAAPGKAVAKKLVWTDQTYLFNNIKSTKVQVVF